MDVPKELLASWNLAKRLAHTDISVLMKLQSDIGDWFLAFKGCP